MNGLRASAAAVLAVLMAIPGISQPQAEATAPGAQKYKLTVVQNASSAKRVKKNRVSAEAVVEVTDQNNVPVPGIAVSFAIPQLVGGGASFTTGGLTSVATTNAAGIASSGSYVAGTNASFSISATASVPGSTLTVTIPVNAAALLGTAAAAGAAGGGAAGGISTGLLVGIIAGAGAAAAVIAKVATGGKGSPTAPPTVSTTIGLGGATVGH